MIIKFMKKYEIKENNYFLLVTAVKSFCKFIQKCIEVRRFKVRNCKCIQKSLLIFNEIYIFK